MAIDHREARLKTVLDPIAKEYEHVIIDCLPTLSRLTINALTASDRVIVIVSPGYFELDSIVQIREKVYSYLSASTGTMVAARKAGYRPEINPIKVAKNRANIGSQIGVYTATLGGGPPCWAVCPAR